jgi:hypothetical protein
MRQSDAFTRIPMRSTVAVMYPSSSVFRLARIGLLSIAASVVLYNASCGSGATSGGTSGDEAENPALADVIFQGEVTDEALEAILAAKIIDNGARAPGIDVPKEGGVLPAATIPTFSWHVGAGGGASIGTTPSFRFAQLAGPDRAASPLKARSPLSSFSELIGPERAASAHGTPFSGTGFWLVFATDADPKLLRVFTDKTSYQPDATAWKKLQGAGMAISLKVVASWFELNKISSDGGPYAGKPVKFTVTP